MNPLCQCPEPGVCTRHGVTKNVREHKLCLGVDCTAETCVKYWNAWEKGEQRGQTVPVPEPKLLKASQVTTLNSNGSIPQPTGSVGCSSCGGDNKVSPTAVKLEFGPGSDLMDAWSKFDMPKCAACDDLKYRMNTWGPDGCEARLEDIIEDILPRAKAWMADSRPWTHAILPGIVEDFGIRKKLRADVTAAIATAREKLKRREQAIQQRMGSGPFVYNDAVMPPLDVVSLEHAVRHLTFHLWPVAGYGAWQWNCDWLLRHAELFNGRRIIAIAESAETDRADAVKEYLKGFDAEFIVVPNNTKLREVATWLPMLELLKPYQGISDVTFSCHGKCVRHKLTHESSTGSTIFEWTRLMYETCLDWDAVRPLLERHGTVGSLRRTSGTMQGNGGFGPWHYSGTFYWWRNRDAFRRSWRAVPQQFFGTEAWPGWMFRASEAGVVFGDNVGDLYTRDEMSRIMGQYEIWKAARHAQD